MAHEAVSRSRVMSSGSMYDTTITDPPSLTSSALSWPLTPVVPSA